MTGHIASSELFRPFLKDSTIALKGFADARILYQIHPTSCNLLEACRGSTDKMVLPVGRSEVDAVRRSLEYLPTAGPDAVALEDANKSVFTVEPHILKGSHLTLISDAHWRSTRQQKRQIVRSVADSAIRRFGFIEPREAILSSIEKLIGHVLRLRQCYGEVLSARQSRVYKECLSAIAMELNSCCVRVDRRPLLMGCR